MSAAVWAGLLAAVLAVEGYTLVNRRGGDTLSEKVWKLRGVKAAQSVLVGTWAWLGYHFFVAGRAATVGDLAVVAGGMAAGWLLPALKPKGKPVSVDTANRLLPTVQCKGRGCGDQVAWRTTPGGARIPLNPRPDPVGNIKVDGPEARTLGKTQAAAAAAAGEVLYMPHHATCVAVNDFRR